MPTILRNLVFSAGLIAGLSLSTSSADQDVEFVDIHTNIGTISLTLYPQKAPQTVANFLEYVDDGFYTDTIFHRVIPDFMVQGGGFTQQYEQKPTRDPIPNEANNGLKNKRGTIAMARTQIPDSATAQFFINLTDNDFLDYRDDSILGAGYAVFGSVTEGMDVVDAMADIPTGPGGPFRQDVPQQPIIIKSVERVDAR
ncbi:MAG TPA: peptidyl-prolyl cis-trans isomerase [Halothiobacillaceae bacterium]|nr:peptidyl-prolyl cis-trans isomerase [Halothiobacillaceae bacterium]